MKKCTFFLLLIVFPLIIIYSQSANATAISNFYGEIHFDTFSFSGSGGLNVASNSEMNQINYWAQSQGGTPDDQNSINWWGVNEWQNTRSRTGSLGDTFGNVSWEQMLSSQQMYSSGSAYANGTTQNKVTNSKAERAANITLSGKGTFSAEVDFSYSYFLNNGLTGDTSSGQIWTQLWLVYSDGGTQFYNDQGTFSENLNGIGTKSVADTGTLSLTIAFDFSDRDSQSAQLWIMTMAQAGASSLESVQVDQTVPEPATMLLFGLGLLGVAGIGRRKK